METTNNVYLNETFNCSPNELFKWMVEPHRICQWFGPKLLKVGRVETDVSLGGAYRIELLKPNGESFFIQGEYLEIEIPTKLSFTFAYIGLHNAPPNSVVKISLKAIDKNVSQLSLIQKFHTAPPDMEQRAKAWKGMLSKLEKMVADKERDQNQISD